MSSTMRDVLIVGGGPVGLFLGTLLAQAGLDVVIWEKRTAPVNTSRAIGIHAPALRALDDAGVGTKVAKAAVRVRRGLAMSQGQLLGEVSFAHVSTHHPYVAALPQARTDAILGQRLDELAAGALVRGVELQDLSWPAGAGAVHAIGHRIERRVEHNGSASTEDKYAASRLSEPGERVEVIQESARFVVGADGARSAVRSLLNIGVSSRRYRDTYVMGDFADSTGSGEDAVVHLEPAGVVESFPLPGLTRRMVVRTSGLIAAPRAEHLAEVIAHRTGVYLDPSTNSMISAFAVRRRLARKMVSGQCILIGDAAHEISPIGGQGMNLGWLDAAALAPLLIAAAGRRRVDGAEFEHFERTRMSSARKAAIQAELNMMLGRPNRGPGLGARNAALKAILASPLNGQLAQAYAMSHR